MKTTDFTYRQLDQVLRSLGFACRPARHEPPGRVYEHEATGAVIMLPAVSESDKVLEHHLAAVRVELDNFGLADATALAAELQKAG